MAYGNHEHVWELSPRDRLEADAYCRAARDLGIVDQLRLQGLPDASSIYPNSSDEGVRLELATDQPGEIDVLIGYVQILKEIGE